MVKNYLLIFSLVSVSLLSSFLEKINFFPEIAGKSVSGQQVNLPQDFKGKNGIVVVSLSQESAPDLKSWIEPLGNVFIPPKDDDEVEEESQRLSDPYNSEAYFLSVHSNDADYDNALLNFKSQLRKELYSRVILSKGNSAAIKRGLNVADPTRAVILVISPEGSIIQTITGEYSDDKMNKIIRMVAEG